MPHAPDFLSGVPPVLLHELPARAAACWAGHTALTVEGLHLTYADLQSQIECFAAGL